MTKFHDGPADGKTLMLKRAPRYLRVVVGTEIDALDQLDDKAESHESIYAYELIGEAGMMHLHRARNQGGFYTIGDYRLCATQPTDEEARDNETWKAWCYKMAGMPLPTARTRTRNTTK